MKFTVKVMGIAVTNWNELRVAIFGEAQPVFEEFGGEFATYEFSEPVSPNNLGPLFVITQIQ